MTSTEMVKANSSVKLRNLQPRKMTKEDKKDLALIKDYARYRKFPFEGDLTNIDTWMLMTVAELNRLDMIGNTPMKFFDEFPEMKFCQTVFIQILHWLDRNGNAWMKSLDDDYITPLGKFRKNFFNDLTRHYQKYLAQVECYEFEIELLYCDFEEEYGYLGNNPYKQADLIQGLVEWFIVRFGRDTYIADELLAGPADWVNTIEKFLDSHEDKRPLFEWMYAKADNEWNVGEMLTAYSMLYTMPRQIKILQDDVWVGRDKIKTKQLLAEQANRRAHARLEAQQKLILNSPARTVCDPGGHNYMSHVTGDGHAFYECMNCHETHRVVEF